MDIRSLDKSSYSTSTDFPIYAGQLSTLQAIVRRENPRKKKSLWSDRRYLGTSLTFKAVIWFGSIGILLGVIQIVLTLIQVVYAIKLYQLEVI